MVDLAYTEILTESQLNRALGAKKRKVMKKQENKKVMWQ